ncbi:arginine catabolic regulator [Weissella paramesenteroides]|jgi:transcriptional regulator of arginine metabolism|uniref:Arginine repressor n=2 Tax=Weissella paramesenteroides TaxID=1249 RepID=C5R8B3_WEIPA|nr:arginine catabolic regulator [Weissella paramesenteroides]ATF40798.1 arginine catabolic regulator [Weissella paramesenteroides]EER75407.1 arginine repressor, C-terminal domain protein [Weissella paramesenteroides ATCC 33313]KAA8440080.1 arginine catabolic regulator [Weissella paramesenteroides]KAA8441076.1 arginine catabolic regulator [Weissella paramesenteroides]KAA8443149.1 arginine catabolic regulator [Weissella paramesenteroides]
MRKTKKERQLAIRELITQKNIQRQEDLVIELNRVGWEVTQATISRDITEMQLVKVPLEAGGFAYAVVAQTDALVRIKKIIQEPTTTIRTQDNFVMITVLPGTGPALKLALEEADFDELFGMLGDDSDVLIILKKNIQATEFVTQQLQ